MGQRYTKAGSGQPSTQACVGHLGGAQAHGSSCSLLSMQGSLFQLTQDPARWEMAQEGKCTPMQTLTLCAGEEGRRPVSLPGYKVGR